MPFRAPRRPVNRVFIHCSDTDNPAHDDVKVIRRWHTSPDRNDPSKPWRDVGYHLFVRKDGTVQKGRPLEATPCAQKGHNLGTVAICLSGKNNFTPEQYDALKALCHEIHAELPLATFHGHREVTPHKSCPRFAYSLILGLDSKGRLT